MKSTLSAPARRAGTYADRAIRYATIALCFLGAGFWSRPASATDAPASPWSSSAKSAARLIASGSLDGGVYHAGIEIRLNPGTLTYWRTPGDAGVPPVFAFAGSVNLAKADVEFPAPTRYLDDGVQTFGYKDDVTFPLDVTPKDASRPVQITLDLRYATCDQICLPAEAKVHLTLAPQQKPGPEASLVAAARAQVPEVVHPNSSQGFSVAPVAAAAKPTWTVGFSPSPSATADLFAEGPDGYYFDTQRTDGFQIVLAQKPADAEGAIAVTLTLVDGKAAYQSTISLDAATAKP